MLIFSHFCNSFKSLTMIKFLFIQQMPFRLMQLCCHAQGNRSCSCTLTTSVVLSVWSSKKESWKKLTFFCETQRYISWTKKGRTQGGEIAQLEGRTKTVAQHQFIIIYWHYSQAGTKGRQGFLAEMKGAADGRDWSIKGYRHQLREKRVWTGTCQSVPTHTSSVQRNY